MVLHYSLSTINSAMSCLKSLHLPLPSITALNKLILTANTSIPKLLQYKTIKHSETLNYLVYPNPSTGNLQVAGYAGTLIKVISAQGEEVYNGQMKDEFHTIPLENKQLKGLFFVSVTSPDGKTEVKKVVLK
jgi:hypothetical protein